jgi:hypothetical protein
MKRRKSITGRDGYIISEALAYFVVLHERVAVETSNAMGEGNPEVARIRPLQSLPRWGEASVRCPL